ncbi:hypothetical protein EDD18DRAFT_1363115 [Armillaria luteobubalina]|uniref:Uncharacterized protein n=1 Tax=Armillaria luteobubalina TaxID=153913 RepID=A0AA39U9I9_9AGAR|nr:hypothetical protein EDD18DRAFT_1363115 [Armillaria luteobubalina]
MPATNSTSRSASKRKLVHSSPVPASVTSSPEAEHVPRKKNKTVSCVHGGSSQRDSALLPPVSITSSQTRPSRTHPTLHRKVSYGELSAKEVENVVTQSDVNEAELSAASLQHRGRVLFVDDEASEASQQSDGMSADDEAAGTDCESDARSSSGIEVVHVATPVPSDIESVGDESVERAESPEVIEYAKPSHSLHSKTKTAKGAYVEKLCVSVILFDGILDLLFWYSSLSSGNGDDVAAGNDTKQDLTVPSHGSRSKGSDSDVYLEDLAQTPKTPSRAKGKAPLKMAMSRCSSCGTKKVAPSSNARLEEVLSIDLVTTAMTKTMAMSKAKTLSSGTKAVSRGDKSKWAPPVTKHSAGTAVTASTVPSPVKRAPSKATGKTKIPVTVSATSTKQTSPRKSAPKASAAAIKKPVDPLFLPLDSDSNESVPPPNWHAQLGADLAALLGDNVRASSPEGDTDTPMLRLPDVFVSQHDADTTDPEDPALHTMQPALMEDHLITLGVYESLPPLGAYRPIIPIGFTPETFDPPRFFMFTDMAKLFRLESLTSLVEAFKFGSYGAFVNLAHVPHSMVSFEKRSLHLSGTNAVCMMMGLITECMLFEPVNPGMFGASKRVRCFQIMPFHQMFRRESTVWSLVIGLSFPMRVEDTNGRGNNNSSYTSTQSSPAKGHRGSPMKKPLGAPALGPGGGYPNSLGFMDEVPVYDGRTSAGNHFLFWPSDFAILKSLPRFTMSHDLDAFTMVSVGYSLTAWESYNKEPRLTPNILFVIVLGSAPKKDKLEALGFLE